MANKYVANRVKHSFKKELEIISENGLKRAAEKRRRKSRAERKKKETAVKTGVPEYLDVTLITNHKGTPIYFRKHRSGSFAEKKIASFLKENNIFYIREVKLGSANFFYDFYLPATDTLIEYNGKQFHSTEDRKKRDQDKAIHALRKGFDLVVLTSKNVDSYLQSLIS